MTPPATMSPTWQNMTLQLLFQLSAKGRLFKPWYPQQQNPIFSNDLKPKKIEYKRGNFLIRAKQSQTKSWITWTSIPRGTNTLFDDFAIDSSGRWIPSKILFMMPGPSFERKKTEFVVRKQSWCKSQRCYCTYFDLQWRACSNHRVPNGETGCFLVALYRRSVSNQLDNLTDQLVVPNSHHFKHSRARHMIGHNHYKRKLKTEGSKIS